MNLWNHLEMLLILYVNDMKEQLDTFCVIFTDVRIVDVIFLYKVVKLSIVIKCGILRAAHFIKGKMCIEPKMVLFSLPCLWV